MKNINKLNKTRKLTTALYAACAVLLGLDFFMPKHGYLPLENIPGVYAAIAIVACVGIVLAARYVLSMITRKNEDYYG